MPATIVIGMQWGDEGKGKIIDLLAEKASWTVRFQGGANAGHTVKIGNEEFALHLLPSGAVREGVRCGIGWGLVIDPEQLIAEIESIEKRGIDIRSRLVISSRASFVLPHHVARDGLQESRRPNAALGTTGRGIGPAYEDRSGRCTLLLSALLEEDGEDLLKAAHDHGIRRISQAGGEGLEAAVTLREWKRWAEEIGPLLGDCSLEVNSALDRGELVLLEGAQGTHLDVYAGTYPYVTSSSTLAGSACVGSGVGPLAINEVAGVAKAYTTRVGNGPFPTEESGEEGERLRKEGNEFGTTTGRPRRCGWLDIPLLRASVLWNGVSRIAMTKLDVLSGRETIPVAVAYEMDGKRLDSFPHSPAALDRVKPIYEEWPGWESFPESPRSFEELPEGAREYVRRFASAVGVPVGIISIGPERSASIECSIEP